MDIDLICAGLIQGHMWISLSPFIDSVIASKPYWWVRTFSGVIILVGEVCFFINIGMTYLTGLEKKKQLRASGKEITA
jgi:cytochrome c oxidase cbb3-type subunit 1